MTYIGPYTQSLNYTHMFDFVDYQSDKVYQQLHTGSIYSLLSSHTDFTLFTSIIDKAKLTTLYDDPQANFTLFAVSDKYLLPIRNIICNLDIAQSRQIIQSLTVNNRIPSELIKDSPASFFYVVNDNTKLFTTNVSDETYINMSCNSASVIQGTCAEAKIIQFDIAANNGIIHIIDKLLFPLFI